MTDQAFFETLKQKAEKGLKQWESASVGLGVIKDGQVLFCGGFGQRDVQAGLPADGDTLYQIGSCSKAFTAAVCAALVAEGKLSWDTPIREYLPGFRLQDAYAEDHCTLRDLLCHRTGLPRHEYSWYAEPFSRQELVDHIQDFEPNQPFRSVFQYNNYGYVLAGHLAERVSGETWEQLVQRIIFDPLGMTRANMYLDTMEEEPNHATPYRHDPAGDGMHGMEQIPFYRTSAENRAKHIGAAFGPAGSINACAADMLKWVALFLNEGKVGEKQIIPWEALKETIQPQMILQSPLDMPQEETTLWTYGMGWFVEQYRGTRLVEHGGNINGFSGFTGFLPEQNLGVVAYTNCDGSFLHYALAHEVMDHFLGVESGDWIQRYYDFTRELHAQLPQKIKAFTGEQVPGTHPSHPMADFAGVYRRPGYGQVRVTADEAGQLTLHFVGSDIPLTHFHYDTFVTADIMGELPVGFPVHFRTAEVGGAVDAVSMPLVTEAGGAPVVFRRAEEPQA